MVRLICTVSSLILEQMLVSSEAREKGLDPGEGRKSSSEDSCQVCTFVYNLSIPTSVTDATDISLSKLQELVKDSKAWRDAVHGVTKSWTGLTE